MKRPLEIAQEEAAVKTIVQVTNAFQGIASMRIAQIKNQVLHAQEFFSEVWQLYTKLREDSQFRFGRDEQELISDKELFIIITSEGGFSGDIDQKLINWMLQQHDKNKQDLVVIGHHGAVQLAQAGVEFKKYYKLPVRDENINVDPLIRHVRQYRTTSVFYQTYVTLMVQDIKRIELHTAVEEQAKAAVKNSEVINEETYIFEPSHFMVVAHLERSMLQIALSQLILDSKLAQYASRFRAMSTANDRASDIYDDMEMAYHRVKRAIADERLHEVLVGIKGMAHR